MPIKFLVLGGCLVFLERGGSTNFVFRGAGILLTYAPFPG